MSRHPLPIIAVVLLASAAPAFGAEAITPGQAAAHVGEVQTVCGTVASAKFASSSKRQPTFLNLDRPYPQQIFTVVIWASDRSKFKEPPERAFSGKRVCVTGSIREYRGTPEIIVTSPDQLRLASADEDISTGELHRGERTFARPRRPAVPSGSSSSSS